MKHTTRTQKILFFLVPIAFSLPVLIFSYMETSWTLFQTWLNNDDFSHGLLILPLTGYLIYRKRDQLAGISIKTDWRASPLLFLPVFVYAVGELGADVFTVRASIFLFVLVLVWFFYGFELVKTLRFPLAFLFLALPLPGLVYRNITFPLQLLASDLSVKALHAMGILAYREGNLIDMGFTQFQVVEACNGLRFILPMLTLGVLFAFWQPLPWWKRVILVGITIPLSIMANVIRIAGTGVAYWGPEVAEGFFHGFSGWVVFMLAFFLFGGISLLLNSLPIREPLREAEIPDKGDVVHRTPSLAAIGVAVATILLTPFIVHYLGATPPVLLKQPLSAFPMEMLGWKGNRGTIEENIWDRVGAQEYVMINYHNEGGAVLNFYSAYYEYQRKAGDFVHTPRLCLPGAGWYIQENRRRELPLNEAAGEVLRLNEMVIHKNNSTMLVYFWYQGRGRNFTSEYTAKFFLIWDGLFRRRTDGALVRLIMSVPELGTTLSARATMDQFAVAAARELDSYLP